ncbi:hypothetical protein C8Q76DRAFT_162735 [Earliella scabrosa]|nr:hypothetical protein C8Q76DRAFT_162735 [Earliella scabrosa]
MENCRIPLEICEYIIDECREWEVRHDSYPVWRRLALVCSAWVSRTQFNLLYEVHIESPSHVDLLIRTLLSRPLLADAVRVLTVVGSDHNPGPFARMPLPRLLKNCFSLEFYLSWSRIPPRYADMGLYLWTDGATVTQLLITWYRYASRAILRYIWSLPSLQQLELRVYGPSKERSVTSSFPASGSPSGRCRALRRLRIVELVRTRHFYTPRCAPGALDIWSEVICQGGAGYRTVSGGRRLVIQPILVCPTSVRCPAQDPPVLKRRSEPSYR